MLFMHHGCDVHARTHARTWQDLGTFTDEFSLPAVDAFDSGFYLITPTMDKGMP